MSAAGRVDVLTFGCRLNIVESEAIRRQAMAAGHRDLTVVNTCAVTAEAVRQSRQAIRRMRSLHPEGRLVVTGCASEIDREGFAGLPGVDAVLPNAGKSTPAAWARADGPDLAVVPAEPPLRPGALHTRGCVEVQNGCDHRCTFCVIPLGRGASRSIEPDQVVDRIRELVAAGAQEVVLTGVDTTSYGVDLAPGLTLGVLVRRVLREIPDLQRLRLSSIDCVEADPVLLEAFASEPRLMPHLHVSLQSGSDLILKRMKRRHSRREAIDFCATIRRLRPETVFGADLIAGFPTEDEAMFGETLDLIGACELTYIHAFPYSSRPGTPAARMPQVPAAVARDRGRRLREAGARRLTRHLDGLVGRRLDVLTERGGKARAADFTLVHVAGDPNPGLLQPVLVTGHDNTALIGEPIGA